MREVDSRRLNSRIKGRPVLERRIRALLVAVHRFVRGRAATAADQQWAAGTMDRLTAALSCDQERH
jgi:hypothetical protein